MWRSLIVLFSVVSRSLFGASFQTKDKTIDIDIANVAQEISQMYRNGAGDMSWLTHKLCHFVLGGGSAALRGEDPLAGAIGATIGEVVANAMIARALEQTRADVLEQLDDFRANYGTLPLVQDAEALIRLTYLEHLEAEQADQIQRIGRLAAADPESAHILSEIFGKKKVFRGKVNGIAYYDEVPAVSPQTLLHLKKFHAVVHHVETGFDKVRLWPL